MQDPLDSYERALTCPFCHSKFTGTVGVKLIPECGKCICGACYDKLKQSYSVKFFCQACGLFHILPANAELPNCTLVLDLLRQPIEKPLSDQARKLKRLVESVEEEMARVELFNPQDYVEQHCVLLEHDVSRAAESAVKHINKIEQDLRKQIKLYRQQCLDALSTKPPESVINADLNALTKDVRDFSAKWTDYFNRLNSSTSESELEAAVLRTDAFRARMRELDQEMRNRALGDRIMQFNTNASFHSARDHLGELVEIKTNCYQQDKEVRLQEQPLRELKRHSDWIRQIKFLRDGRLASCSEDRTIKVWDTASGTELFALKGHKSFVYSIVVLSNDWFASASADKTIKVWDLDERVEVRTLEGHTGSVYSLGVLKNGNLASYSKDDSIKIWNPYLTTNNLLLTITGHGNRSWIIPIGALSNDLLVTFTRDNDDKEESVLRVWNPLNGGQLVKSLPIGLKGIWPVLVLSNDQIAVGTTNGTIKIISLPEDNPEQTTRTREKAHDLGVSCLLQASNHNLVSSGQEDQSSSFIYSIKVWRLSDLSLLQQLDSGHSDVIFTLRLSQDQTLLASGSSDKTIKLWLIVVKDAEFQSDEVD